MFFMEPITFAPFMLTLHCLFLFLFKRWLGPIGTFFASVLSFTFVIACSIIELYTILLNGTYSYVDLGRWFFCIDLIDSHLVFCLDPLALIASTLVMLLTVFALYFGVEYMYREAFINRLLYLLNLFATSVVFLFYCYDFFLILFAWECIGLFSLLLVNFYSTRIYTIKAALKTFIFSRISDMFMFITFILTIGVFNTTDLSLIFIQTPFYAFHYIFFGSKAVHFLTIFSFCLATSGVIKSAQFFFHVWLPDAMEAPTPASALIHSSTLVVAGVFLIIRFSIIFEFTSFTNTYLALLGATTLAFASVVATFQNDIKKLVAYSTISQIGYLVCGCGFCCYEEVLIYLIVHALNKAFLFVLVGYIVHFFSGNTDLRQMGGSYLYSLDLTVLLFAVAFNLSGLPYSTGFLAKEFLLLQVLRDDIVTLFVRGCWLVSFFFTPIYMFILTVVVKFNVRKGSISVYNSIFTQNSNYSLQTLFLYLVKKSVRNPGYMRVCPSNIVSYYHFTSVTSRLTSYLLFMFWLFFTFYGESLLLVTLNYLSLIDTIPSNSFLSLKQHVIFFLITTSTEVLNYLNLYIYGLLVCALGFLLNFNYVTNYKYFKQSTSLGFYGW